MGEIIGFLGVITAVTQYQEQYLITGHDDGSIKFWDLQDTKNYRKVDDQ